MTDAVALTMTAAVAAAVTAAVTAAMTAAMTAAVTSAMTSAMTSAAVTAAAVPPAAATEANGRWASQVARWRGRGNDHAIRAGRGRHPWGGNDHEQGK
jgi:hypothetical protein